MTLNLMTPPLRIFRSLTGQRCFSLRVELSAWNRENDRRHVLRSRHTKKECSNRTDLSVSQKHLGGHRRRTSGDGTFRNVNLPPNAKGSANLLKGIEDLVPSTRNDEIREKAMKRALESALGENIADSDKEPVLAMDRFDLFASCLPGLEHLLREEIDSLGFLPLASGMKSLRLEKGGVSFHATSPEDIMKCHLHLGTASHILLRCGDPFRARGMVELVRSVSKMKFWRQYLKQPDHGEIANLPKFDIRVSATKSRLYHTAGIAERVERGIAKALGFSESKMSEIRRDDNDIVPILVRAYKDNFDISIDTSSTPLHRRGYRKASAKAPLREDLAFALLFASGWGKPKEEAMISSSGKCLELNKLCALLDPFCGSGTIIIEGAAMALGLAPGRLRPAPMGGSRFFNNHQWNRLVRESNKERCKKIDEFAMMGSDRDEGAIRAAQDNAARAGVSHVVSFLRSSVSSTPWFENPESISGKGLLVATNPPFGRRIRSNKREAVHDANKLLPLYQTLGHKIEHLGIGAKAGMIAHDINLARRTGLKGLNIGFRSNHGGLPIVGLVTD